jgi:hypothetical protein
LRLTECTPTTTGVLMLTYDLMRTRLGSMASLVRAGTFVIHADADPRVWRQHT